MVRQRIGCGGGSFGGPDCSLDGLSSQPKLSSAIAECVPGRVWHGTVRITRRFQLQSDLKQGGDVFGSSIIEIIDKLKMPGM